MRAPEQTSPDEAVADVEHASRRRVAASARVHSSDVLTEAVRGVDATWAPLLSSDAAALLIRAVVEARAGRAIPSFEHAPWTVVARPALDAMRRRILSATETAADHEAYAECHALLIAIERVHDHLQRDDLYRVADQLGGARALELLVEVAHDMRSPLGSILFLVDRVRSGQSGPVTEAQAKQLGLAYSAAFGLSSLASDVMELARGSGRLIGADPVPFALSEVMRTVRGMVQPVAEEKGLKLHTRIPVRDVRLGHPAALSRVLLNLCTNACKYTERGSIWLEARVVDATRVEFLVRDSGRGVPPAVAAMLFDSFRPRTGAPQAGSSHAFSSAGLGLAICRKLVYAMGGELLLDLVSGSSESQGSVFRFSIALARAS